MRIGLNRCGWWHRPKSTSAWPSSLWDFEVVWRDIVSASAARSLTLCIVWQVMIVPLLPLVLCHNWVNINLVRTINETRYVIICMSLIDTCIPGSNNLLKDGIHQLPRLVKKLGNIDFFCQKKIVSRVFCMRGLENHTMNCICFFSATTHSIDERCLSYFISLLSAPHHVLGF